MADKILVPLDGSHRAEQILVQVARLLRREDAEVVLVRAVDIPTSLARQDTAALLKEEREAAAAYLKNTTYHLAQQGVRVRHVLREAPAVEAILQVALEEKVSLIALSTHGRSGLARWLLGSTAERVLRGATVPVLLTRSFPNGPQGIPLPAGPGELPFRRILVPLDGSETSLQIVPKAAELATLFGAAVDVLSVDVPVPVPVGGEVPPFSPPPPQLAGEGAQAHAMGGVTRFQDRGLRARPLTAVGDPASRILETAETEHADLIAMATHGWTGMARWMLGSVTERVLRHATLPMLIVRPSKQ